MAFCSDLVPASSAGFTRMKSLFHLICLPELVGRPPGKNIRQDVYLSDVMQFHQQPVRKWTGTGSGDLPGQQLDRAVKDSAIVRFEDTEFATTHEANHAPVLDRSPDPGIRSQGIFLVFSANQNLCGTVNPDRMGAVMRLWATSCGPECHGSSTASSQPVSAPHPSHAAAVRSGNRTGSLH